MADLAKIYQAYNSGQMTPEEAQQYESDVADGYIELPQGASLKPQGVVNAFQGMPATPQQTQQTSQQQAQAAQPAMQQNQQPFEADNGILEAYQNDYMTRDEKMQFEQDVKNGVVQVPQGFTMQSTKPADKWDVLKDMITGSERQTKEIQGMQNFTSMPEMNVMPWEKESAWTSFKTAAGTMATNPEETVKIIKANNPNVQVRQDDKGNYIMKSAIDGQEYAIAPGMTVGDIPRVLGVLLAFTPQGRATTMTGAAVGGAATQAAIEGTQAATGGEFNPEQAVMAGVGGAVGQKIAQGLGVAGGAVKKGYQRFMQKAATQPEQQAVVETAQQAAKGGLTSQGDVVAKKELAQAVRPDAETIAAAKRLGVLEHLQPDHVSTNQSYIELVQAAKSIPGSDVHAAEIEGLSQVAQRADKIITEIGGSKDLSLLNANVKSQLEKIQYKLETGSGKLYDKVAAAVPPKTPAPANNLINYLKQEAENMGGVEKLDPMERKLMSDLEGEPTYAFLDKTRKSLTAARVKKEGVFKDMETGTIKKLEKELLKDQQAAVESTGDSRALSMFNAARKSVAVRKGIEDDMTALFGKELDKSMIPSLTTATKGLAKGDADRLVKMINSIPKSMRQEVVASGLTTAFGKNARDGLINFNSYAKWFRDVNGNSRAMQALAQNLPRGAVAQLKDLAKVSEGISRSTKEFISTGRINYMKEQLNNADSFMAKMYDFTKRVGAGAVMESMAGPAGMPGVGMTAAITSAVMKNKTPMMRAVDAVIADPAFVNMAVNSSATNAKKLVMTPAWQRFIKYATPAAGSALDADWVLEQFKPQEKKQ